MKRYPRRHHRGYVLVGAAAIVLLPCACTHPLVEPPQLGDCIPAGDAGCTNARGGGPAGGPHLGDGGTGLDATPVTLTPDGGSCGQADVLISSATQNPTCRPCILAAPASGALNCCMSDAACSNDVGCLAILQCALPCNGDSACVGACEAFSTQGSVQNYNAFGSCLAQQCSPECPPLPQATTADH